MTREQAEKLTAWLLEASQNISYGEVSITVTQHDGQTRNVEKMTKERAKC